MLRTRFYLTRSQLNSRVRLQQTLSGETAFADLDSLIAEAIQTYLTATRDGLVDRQWSSLDALSSALARLLKRHLEEHPRWSRWSWVDDITVQAANALSPTSLEVWGLALWDDGTGEQWVEPFAATLQVEARERKLAEYRLRFGDAALGLGQRPFGSRQKHLVCDNPPEWLFTFDSPAA